MPIIARVFLVLLLTLAAGRANAQSREQIDRLASLGQVWGFLKYYHPGVAAGRVDWDSVLVAAVPRIRNARSALEYRAVIQTLLDAAGPVPECAPLSGGERRCRALSPGVERVNLDERWLEDTTRFGQPIVRQLARLRDDPHQGSGRYVAFRLTAVFDADTAFNAPAFPAEEVRLLSLFRFWNAAQYYFPYMYVNGGDWSRVLREFVPRLIASHNAEEYHLTVAELTARLHDAHVSAASPTLVRILGSWRASGETSPATGAPPTSTVTGYRFPAFQARFIEGKIVVWKLATDAALNGGLRVGDVITHINGEPVAELRRSLVKYTAAGNDAVLKRKLLSMMLYTLQESATYTVEREGRTFTSRVPMAPRPTGQPAPPTPVRELARVLPNTNIGYLSLGDLNPPQVDSALEIVRKTEGLVIDVRNYPRNTMYQVAAFLNPKPRPFVRFTAVDSTYPGQMVWLPELQAGPAGPNPDYYRGRVAILVDERTQSHAEFTVMALRTAPQNKVIGSQTAGADGNITWLSLPGGIRTLFTGLGVYYPDGTPTQRVGIVPDIEVLPTVAGVRRGKDEVLDRAIAYVRSGR